MKIIRLPQVALLGWALLMATASASAQQERSWLWNAGGVELKLPSTWQEISPSLLRGKVSALGMSVDRLYGAETSKAGDNLTYPYLLVTIKNGGRMADWQLRQMEQSIRQSVEKSGSQLGRYASKDGAVWVEVTTGAVKFMNVMAHLIKPQGHVVSIVDNAHPVELNLLKSKSVSFHWTFMFTRSMFHTPDMQKQGLLLNQVAKLVDAGKIRTTHSETLSPINAANLRSVHAKLESGR